MCKLGGLLNSIERGCPSTANGQKKPASSLGLNYQSSKALQEVEFSERQSWKGHW